MDSRDRRLQQIRELYVLHPLFKSLIRDIDDCREDSKLGGPPECMLVTGDTGVGKSSLIAYYQEKHPPIEKADGTYSPILICELPQNATPKSVAAELLSELGDPAAFRSGTEVEITHGLITLLKNMEVELIILDEFQHLIQKSSNRVMHDTADWLKSIINKSGVPVVLFGMPWSREILSCNRQLARRFSLQRKIEHFYLSKADSRQLFRDFLAKIDGAMPFDGLSELDSKVMTLRLFAASKGNIGDLMTLIYRAAKFAIDDSKGKIELACFIKAWQKYYKGLPNPFDMPPTQLNFMEVVEPHRWDWQAEKGKDPMLPQQLRRLNVTEIFR
jgi:hypothetical protein